MKRPARLARADVECLHVTRRLLLDLRPVRHLGAGHDDVATHLWSARRLIGCRSGSEAALQVHAAAVAPAGNRLAGARIERHKVFADLSGGAPQSAAAAAAESTAGDRDPPAADAGLQRLHRYDPARRQPEDRRVPELYRALSRALRHQVDRQRGPFHQVARGSMPRLIYQAGSLPALLARGRELSPSRIRFEVPTSLAPGQCPGMSFDLIFPPQPKAPGVPRIEDPAARVVIPASLTR